ncbi:MAG: hypothetical protein QM776_05110 [Rhodocyclaceae bacterium]
MFTASSGSLRRLYACLCLSLLALGTGCATTSDASKGAHEQLYRDGVQALNDGQKDKALQLLDASARANPAYSEPWVKAAQIHFEAGNYPMAIKSADEAMKRDPSRRETKAIAVVASLRVAMHALGEMREDASLRGNTRLEAEQLARTLRETLSVEVLVPGPVSAGTPSANTNNAAHKAPAVVAPAPTPAPAAAAPAAATPAAAPARPAAARPTPAPAPAATRKTPEPAASGGSNPFNVLK